MPTLKKIRVSCVKLVFNGVYNFYRAQYGILIFLLSLLQNIDNDFKC